MRKHRRARAAERRTEERRTEERGPSETRPPHQPRRTTMSGRNALFIPGPTNMPDAVRLAMDIPLEDQRAPDFPAFTLGLFQDLKKIFKTRAGQVFLFPDSGTGGRAAGVHNTLFP